MGEARSPSSTKQELIDATTTAWDAFVASVDGVPEERWTGPTDAAGWSVKDHVSHVTQWDRAVIERLRNHGRLQETLGVSDTAWTADSFDPMNEELRRRTANDAVPLVKADRDATWRELVSLLGALSEEQLAQSGTEVGLGIGDGERPLSAPVVQVLDAYWGAHYDEHRQCITAIVEGEPT